MREGDYLVGIGDNDVKWSSHEDVVRDIKASANKLKVKLVTPLDSTRGNNKSSYKEKVSSLSMIFRVLNLIYQIYR